MNRSPAASLGVAVLLSLGPANAARADSTIWDVAALPGTVDWADGNAVELGVKFRSDVAGSITGIRFYKASANTGTHVGNLWTSTGTLLASATFTGESASGWQQVTFATPVPIRAQTVYVASYHTEVGHYSADQSFFGTAGVDNPPLHALADGASGGNGVYAYGAASSFPSSTYMASNYWVDVAFSAAPTPSSIAVAPVSPSISAGAMQQFTATGTYADSSTSDVTSLVTWASSAPGVAAMSAGGLATVLSPGTTTISATLGSVSGSTGLTAPAPPGVSIWPATAVPGTVDWEADSNAVELGVKFWSEVAGSITGIRFYKASANTGTHVGNLWTSTGALLASATFTGETTAGWQQASFAAPVSITANTVYVASYHTEVGHYSADQFFFGTAGVDNPPLHALADGVLGGNGVYAYGATSSFPSSSYMASNYWVDVAFGCAPGAPCDDGNACTYSDSCDASGACVGTPIVCTSDACNQRSCNGTPSCTITPRAGQACDDGNACTYADTCNAGGACVGTALTCTSDACNQRSCNGTSSCTATPLPGNTCDDANLCTYGDTCNSSGVCVGTPAGCVARGPCEQVQCNGGATCSLTVAARGTACSTPGNTCGQVCDGVSPYCQPAE